jgi:hypothetical protein
MATLPATKVTSTNRHWFTDKKEQVYFIGEMTLPRGVGEVRVRVTAERNEIYDDSAPNKRAMGEWRIFLDRDSIPGVGPKTIDTVRDALDLAIMAWLESDEYAPSKKKAIAQYIAREAADNRWGRTRAVELLKKHKKDITVEAYASLDGALTMYQRADKLLTEVSGDD